MSESVKYRQMSPKMVRVLFVNLQGRVGGAERSLLLLVKYLRDDFDIAVACPVRNSLTKRLTKMQITSLNLPGPPKRLHLSSTTIAYLIKVCFALIKIIRKVRPTIIHANSFYAATVSVLPALLTRRKFIWHARDLEKSLLASKLCSFFCKRIIAVSYTVKKSLTNQCIKPTKIDVVYNGVEIKNCNRIVLTKSKDAPVKFANIGQFVPWKRQDLFIEAACRLIQKAKDAEFVLIGDDIFGRDYEYKTKLLNKIKTCAVAEKITYLDWRDSLDNVWDNIDCLVHTAYPEPFGRVIIEAMAHKVPVIAVNSHGPAEIIRDGRTGILVDHGDIERLRDAMLKIADNKKLATRLASAGYEQVTSNFSAEQTANSIRKIYKQIFAA